MTGEKVLLGFIQSLSENSRSIKQFLKGLFFITDGSKGIKKALDEVFPKKYVHQRCQRHKRENVVSHLKDEAEKEYRKRLLRAYSEPTYTQAKQSLRKSGMN